MIAPAKRKRKLRKKYRGAAKNMPEFKPEWINAFIIGMLAKLGGVQAITLDQLKAFDEVSGPKQPDFSWNGELQAFVLTTPGMTKSDAKPDQDTLIQIPAKPKLIT